MQSAHAETLETTLPMDREQADASAQTTRTAGALADAPKAIRFSAATSTLVAAAIGAGFLVAYDATGIALPGGLGAAIGGAVFLLVIAQQDCQHRKIPNWASGLGLLGAIAYHAYLGGGAGALAAVIGALVPFVLLLAPYALRVLGAGDVKAFMVLGALFGIPAMLNVLVWTAMLGGGLALLLVAKEGELRRLGVRWGRIIANRVPGRSTQLEVPAASRIVSAAMPLGPAIGLAAIAHVLSAGGAL